MNDQLPIFQELDNYLDDKRLHEIFQNAARALSPKYDVVAIKSITPIVFMLLKQGIQYVHQKYGIVADHFIIDGDTPIPHFEGYDPSLLYYQPERDAIVTNYSSLGRMGDGVINVNHGRRMAIAPLEHWGKHYYINIKDGIFLGGVEEAHHAYYIKSGGSYYQIRTEEEYMSAPWELAAWEVVRQAIREYNIQLYISKNGRFVSADYPGEDASREQ
jgi:hypothetical protein